MTSSRAFSDTKPVSVSKWSEHPGFLMNPVTAACSSGMSCITCQTDTTLTTPASLQALKENSCLISSLGRHCSKSNSLGFQWWFGPDREAHPSLVGQAVLTPPAADPPGLSRCVIASASLLPCCVFLLSDVVSVSPAPTPFLCLSVHRGWGRVSAPSPSSLTLLGGGNAQLRAGWGHSVIHGDLSSRKTSGLDTVLWQTCWFTWPIRDGNMFFLWQKATFSSWYVVGNGCRYGRELPPPAEQRQF